MKNHDGSAFSVRGARCWSRTLIVLSCFVLVSGGAFAQTPAVQRMEFDAAIEQALERNPTIAQAEVAVARADALVRQARAFTLPSVSAGVTNATLDSARGFEGGVTQPQNQFSFVGSARYQLGGWAEVRQARDQVAVAAASSTEARQVIATAAANAYLAVIAGQHQVEVAARALEAGRAHLEYASRRLEGGAGSRLNQLRAAQLVTSDELRLENAELGLRRAQEALGVIVVADGPVDAGAEPAFEVPVAIEEAGWTATRPDLLTRRASQQAADRVVRDHWLEWVPFPSLSFDPVLVAPSGLFQPSRTWRFSVSVTQPLFDGGERRAVRLLRENALENARLALTETEIRARSEVRIARDALESLDRALSTARQAVEQANEVLRITTAAFEVGATTNIEVIDAQRSARDAESEAAVAEDAVRRGRLDLLVALGRFPQ